MATLGKPAVSVPRSLEPREIAAQIGNIAERLRLIERELAELQAGGGGQAAGAAGASSASTNATALARSFGSIANGLLAKVSATGFASRRLVLPPELEGQNVDGATGNPTIDWAAQPPGLVFASPISYDGRPEFRMLAPEDAPWALFNPMTASGDLIVGGTGGLPTRLGVGTSGQVLTIVGGAPAWGESSGGVTLEEVREELQAHVAEPDPHDQYLPAALVQGTGWEDTSPLGLVATPSASARVVIAPGSAGKTAFTVTDGTGDVRFLPAGALPAGWSASTLAGDWTIQGRVFVPETVTVAQQGFITLLSIEGPIDLGPSWSGVAFGFSNSNANFGLSLYLTGANGVALAIPTAYNPPPGATWVAPRRGEFWHFCFQQQSNRLRMWVNGQSIIYRVSNNQTFDWVNLSLTLPTNGTLRIGAAHTGSFYPGVLLDHVQVDTAALYPSTFDPILTLPSTAGANYYANIAAPVQPPAASASTVLRMLFESVEAAARAIALATPRNINGVPFDGTADIELPETILLPVTDETSVPTAGTNRYSVRLPRRFALQGMRVSASVPQASGSPLLGVNVRANGVSVLAAPYVLDNNVRTSLLSSTQPVVLEQVLADDSEIAVDITQIAAASSARGIKVRLYGKPSFVNGDQFYPAVSLLLQNDGANGTNGFLDTSPRPKTFTLIGNPVFSTAVAPPFGSSAILFDGSSALSVPHSSDFDFGAFDWTIEYHLWVPAGAPTFNLLSKRPGFGYGPLAVIYDAPTRRILTYCDVNTSDFAWQASIATPTNGINAGTWYHIAVVRLGTELRCFFNGTYSSQVTGAFTAGQALAPDTNPFFIATTQTIGSNMAVCRLRGLRITRGFARYTTNFAAPTGPYLEF